MPAVTRRGVDASAGHCYPPRPADSGSPNVFANGIPVVRVTDHYPTHCCGDSCHDGAASSGSSTVFVNGLRVHRIGDAISCGDMSANGSPNVFAGDQRTFVISFEDRIANQKTLDAYVSNPSAFAIEQEEEVQVKAYYPGTPATDSAVQVVTPVPVPPAGTTVIPFLIQCLAEADQGLWRESGQGGNPSNEKILRIWKELGFSQADRTWASDQTAWCAGFVQFALKNSGMAWIPEAGARNTVARADKFRAIEVPLSDMQPGDIALWTYNHVNFCYTSANGKYTFVGGNQSPRGVNNPADGDLTQSWSSGWTPSKGGIVKVIRPQG